MTAETTARCRSIRPTRSDPVSSSHSCARADALDCRIDNRPLIPRRNIQMGRRRHRGNNNVRRESEYSDFRGKSCPGTLFPLKRATRPGLIAMFRRPHRPRQESHADSSGRNRLGVPGSQHHFGTNKLLVPRYRQLCVAPPVLPSARPRIHTHTNTLPHPPSSTLHPPSTCPARVSPSPSAIGDLRPPARTVIDPFSRLRDAGSDRHRFFGHVEQLPHLHREPV